MLPWLLFCQSKSIKDGMEGGKMDDNMNGHEN